jgi:hypothetical protein
MTTKVASKRAIAAHDNAVRTAKEEIEALLDRKGREFAAIGFGPVPRREPAEHLLLPAARQALERHREASRHLEEALDAVEPAKKALREADDVLIAARGLLTLGGVLP